MTQIATAKPHLEGLFGERRSVFWHDREGQRTALRVVLVQTLSDGKRISL